MRLLHAMAGFPLNRSESGTDRRGSFSPISLEAPSSEPNRTVQHSIGGDAVAGLPSGPEAIRLFAMLLLGVLLIAAARVIVEYPTAPQYDQSHLLASRFDADHMPSPAKGLTSQLMVATIRLAVPAPQETLNAAVRLIAMLLYTVSAALMASAFLRRPELVATFTALLFASQFPFLWISSELFTAAFLFLAILAWSKRAAPWLVGALLACFGLAKPDAIFTAIALLGYWTWRSASPRAGLLLVSGFAGGLAALLLPGLLLHGMAYFETWEQQGGRGFSAFREHFCWTLQHFQIESDRSADSFVYLQKFFGDADSLWEVWMHPQGWFVYLEFVALSIVRGVVKTGYLASYSLLALPVLAWAWRREGTPLGARARSLLLCFVGVAPLVLLVYPHMRYMARFYPIYLVIVLGAAERLGSSARPSVRAPAIAAAGLCLGLTLITHVRRAFINLTNIAYHDAYWFPD